MSRTHKTTQTLSPEYVILGLLKMEPSHGYALHQRLEADLSQVWRISLSQAYNILHRLDKQGFIQRSGDESTAQHADRVPFQVTEAGDAHFKTWMRTPVGPSVRAIRMAFISKLYFARQLGQPNIEELVAVQRSAIVSKLEQLRARIEPIPKAQFVNRLGLQLRIKQLESLQSWFEETINDIPIPLERGI
jgi:PadR family transcriptional regulator, regulatory protein AphA